MTLTWCALNLTSTLKCSWSLDQTDPFRRQKSSERCHCHQGPVRTFLEGFYPMLPTLQVPLTPESLVLTLLEILGCLLFQESVVLSYAPCMSGVESGYDPRVRWSWYCWKEDKLLYSSVSLKFHVLSLETLNASGYQGGNKSFFDLVLPVNHISQFMKKNRTSLNGVECLVCTSFDLFNMNDVMLKLVDRCWLSPASYSSAQQWL